MEESWGGKGGKTMAEAIVACNKKTTKIDASKCGSDVQSLKSQC